MEAIENTEKLEESEALAERTEESEPVTEEPETDKTETETADMVRAKEPVPQKTEEGGAIGYRLLALFAAILSIGGLFLGMLGSVASFLTPCAYFNGNATILEGSLIGYGYGYVQSLFAEGATPFASVTESLESIVSILLLVALVAAVVFSVVACIIALVSRKNAARFSLISMTAVFTAYCGLFLWSYFAEGEIGSELSTSVCDIPTAIIACLALAGLSVAAIARNRYSAANLLLLLCSLSVAFFVSYPGSLTRGTAAQDLFSFDSGLFVKIALLFFMFVIAFNVLCSAIRLPCKRGYLFDCIRFGLLLLGAILSVVAFLVTSEPSTAIFQGNQLIYSIAFLALTLLALILSIIMKVIVTKQANAESEAVAEPAKAVEDVSAATSAEAEATDASETAAETALVSAPAETELTEENTESAEKEEIAEPEADEAPYYTEIPHAFLPAEEVPEGPIVPEEPFRAEPEPVAAAEPEPVAPVEPVEPEPVAPAEPVEPEPVAPAEPVAPPAPEPAPSYPTYSAAPQPPVQKEAPMSEFERRMEALARGEQPEYAPQPSQAPQYQQMQFQPQQPQYPQQPAQAPQYQQMQFQPPQYQPQQKPYVSPITRVMPAPPAAQGGAGYADNQYTYDPFINGLSPQEKNEFGDLFIACKMGKVDGLPIYTIGGNNSEFFRKVFIYLGKFRKDISTNLLDKLYQYVSKN